jgi:hypothetical protein
VFVFVQMSRVGIEIEICSRSVIFLLRCHHARILSTMSLGSRGGLGTGTMVGETADNEGFSIPPLSDIISEIKDTLRASVLSYRDLVGTNIAALKHISRDVEAKRTMNQFLGDLPDVPSAAVAKKKRKKARGGRE